MAEGGEEKAILLGVKNDAMQALPKAAEHAGQFTEDTADGIDKALEAHAANEAEVTANITTAGERPPDPLPTASPVGDGSAASTTSGNTTRILQSLESGESAAPQLGAQDMKALNPGKAAKSIRQIRNIKDPATRWKAAEQNARERYGGGPERGYPVPANSDPDFPITKATTRKVDCPVDQPGGGTLAVEVKMYQQYRRVQLPDGEFANQKVEVPLSDDIRLQINKDVALRNADSSYDPRWEFQGAGPSQELRDYLTKAGIIFVEHH